MPSPKVPALVFPPTKLGPLGKCGVPPCRASTFSGCEADLKFKIVEDTDSVLPSPVPSSACETPNGESVELLCRQLDAELRGETREASHSDIREAWHRFTKLPPEEFERIARRPSVKQVDITFQVTLTRRPKTGFNFGTYCHQDYPEAVFVDHISCDGVLDLWNRRARLDGRRRLCVHPFAAIVAVNDVSGDNAAMKSQLYKDERRCAVLTVRNPGSVRDAIAVAHTMRIGGFVERPFWKLPIDKECQADFNSSTPPRESLPQDEPVRRSCADMRPHRDCSPPSVPMMCGLESRKQYRNIFH